MAVAGLECLTPSVAMVNCEDEGEVVRAGRARVEGERLKRTVRPVDRPAATTYRCVGIGDHAIAYE